MAGYRSLWLCGVPETSSQQQFHSTLSIMNGSETLMLRSAVIAGGGSCSRSSAQGTPDFWTNPTPTSSTCTLLSRPLDSPGEPVEAAHGDGLFMNKLFTGFHFCYFLLICLVLSGQESYRYWLIPWLQPKIAPSFPLCSVREFWLYFILLRMSRGRRRKRRG